MTRPRVILSAAKDLACPVAGASKILRWLRSLRMTAAALALAPTLALAQPPAPPPVRHLPASTGLGEGTPQPGDAPLPIPDASPRPRRPAPNAAPYSARLAESVMRRNPQVHRRWDYTAGVVLTAIERVGAARRDQRLLDYVRTNMERFVRPDGTIEGYRRDEYNLDHLAPGVVVLALHARTDDPRWRRAADTLRAQLRTHPRTAERGLWHKRIYPEQMWLDGLFMAQPFQVRYALALAAPAERDSMLDDAARQFLLMARHARDPRTGLLVHGWDAARAQPWADSLTGRSPNVWGRAMGWYLVGLVEVLDALPAAHPDRGALLQVLRDAADAVARVQDPVTGLWWDVMDQPDRAGNWLEGSASAMFAYALGRAARLGHVDARHRRVAERAFDGLVANLLREHADGTLSLVNVAQVSGLGGAPRKDGSLRDGSFAYYVSEPVVTDDYKGVGPLILAALELGR